MCFCDVVGSCPSGSWTYDGSCYRLTQDLVTHEDAACPPPEYLAEITSQAEDLALYGM